MDDVKIVQQMAMATVQDFMNQMTAQSQQHAFLMLLSLASATGHVMAALQGCPEAAGAFRQMAEHFDKNPPVPTIAHDFASKAATVAGNNTIN